MKRITSYIPCYIGNDEKFCEWLGKTIDSIRQYKDFGIVKLFLCQLDKESKLKERTKKYDNINIVFLEEDSPMLFPIDVFNYMKNDKLLDEDDYIFYVEGDHILHIEYGFSDKIYEEIERGNCVMPHRLGEIRANKNIKYEKYEGLYVGNYGKTCIRKYNEIFNEVIPYKYPNNKINGTYAGCYFIKKSTLGNVENIRIHRKGLMYLIRRYIGIFHKYGLLRKFGLPYTMRLGTPSLILPFRGIKVLKSIEVGNCWVEHLSQNGYV